MTYVYAACTGHVLLLVLAVNSNQFQILRRCVLLLLATRSYALLSQITNTSLNWQNSRGYRDGVKVLWCHSHLVWLAFEGSISTCACFRSENFFVTFYILGKSKSLRFEIMEFPTVVFLPGAYRATEGSFAVNASLFPLTLDTDPSPLSSQTATLQTPCG